MDIFDGAGMIFVLGGRFLWTQVISSRWLFAMIFVALVELIWTLNRLRVRCVIFCQSKKVGKVSWKGSWYIWEVNIEKFTFTWIELVSLVGIQPGSQNMDHGPFLASSEVVTLCLVKSDVLLFS